MPLLRIVSLIAASVFVCLQSASYARAQSQPTLVTLYNFYPPHGFPLGGLTYGSDGNLYGVTPDGGMGTGTVFRITPEGALTTLHAFNPVNEFDTSTNAGGVNPDAPVIETRNGNVYGTTPGGGKTGGGTVFKISPTSGFTTLYKFSKPDAAVYGSAPASLIQGNDGNFYGVTTDGGTSRYGTIFKITPAGALTVLYSFSGFGPAGVNSDGFTPIGNLVACSGGIFYGVTLRGGSGGTGTIFRITSDGVLTSLYSFSSLSDFSSGTNTDGASPGGLIQADDGNFYGVTSQGGPFGTGTAFRITPEGVLTTLYNFSFIDPNGINANGAYPGATLVQGSDGNFYGATGSGPNGTGTLFQMTPTGDLTTLHSFDTQTESGINSDGAYPSTLIQPSPGIFYGTTSSGGPAGCGTVFKLIIAPQPASPVITSITNDQVPVGLAYTYQITATDHPTAYSATGLPEGLSLDSVTGLISGVATEQGVFAVSLSAINGNSVGAATVLLTVVPGVVLKATVPEVTTGSGEVGVLDLSLTAASDHDLLVNFSIEGSAVNGTDYEMLKTTKKFKAGTVSKSIDIIPLGVGAGPGVERVVTLVLKPGDGYALGTVGKVRVKIVGQ